MNIYKQDNLVWLNVSKIKKNVNMCTCVVSMSKIKRENM